MCISTLLKLDLMQHFYQLEVCNLSLPLRTSKCYCLHVHIIIMYLLHSLIVLTRTPYGVPVVFSAGPSVKWFPAGNHSRGEGYVIDYGGL